MRKQVTTFSRPFSTAPSWEASVLVQLDARYVPTMLRDLEARKKRYFYPDDESYLTGINTVNRAQEALLMDIGTKLIMEIRAARGVDELDPGYNDPDTDPFTLQMGNLEKLSVGLDDVSAKLQAILDSLTTQQSPEELAQILEQVTAVAALLA